MILFFFLIALIVLLLVFIILTLKRYELIYELLAYTFIALVAVDLMAMTVALCIGYSNPFTVVKTLADKRELIEFRIKTDTELNIDTLNKIRDYNNDVNYANNYWCRFNIEDRTVYLIDEQEYINSFNK